MNQMSKCPLRYRISNWKQLEECQSNTSRDLHIIVTKYFNNDYLSGLKIRIEHDYAGTMFAYILYADGRIINKDLGYIPLDTATILQELARFGFYVEYNPVKSLSGDQLQYLMTLNNLRYNKIRWITVHGIKDSHTHSVRDMTTVVAFNSHKNGNWLNYGYSPSHEEFLESLQNGSAINLSAVSETLKYNWDWLLGFVASINDILEEQYSKCCRG